MNTITRLALTGLAAVAFSGAASASTNLVANGDFQAKANLAGWTAKGLAFESHVKGNDFASFAGIGSLSQNVATAAGSEYELSFDLLSISLGSVFDVKYGGSTIFSSVDAGFKSGHYDLDFAGVNNGKLTFAFLGLGAAALDNISVTKLASIPAVPEPAPAGLLAAGVGLLGLVARRRRSAR